MTKYKYKRFQTDDESTAGKQLVNFLNKNPDIEIINVQFTNNTTEFNHLSNYYVGETSEYCHLVYLEDKKERKPQTTLSQEI